MYLQGQVAQGCYPCRRLTLMMKVVKFFQSILPFAIYQSTQRKIPEDSILHKHCCGNSKSHKLHSICQQISSVERTFFFISHAKWVTIPTAVKYPKSISKSHSFALCPVCAHSKQATRLTEATKSFKTSHEMSRPLRDTNYRTQSRGVFVMNNLNLECNREIK